ncbi:MAG: hypothetical protein JWP42_134 [Pseudomonas sp.]|nr:hypothetical protein [Pseudomonas sp.]
MSRLFYFRPTRADASLDDMERLDHRRSADTSLQAQLRDGFTGHDRIHLRTTGELDHHFGVDGTVGDFKYLAFQAGARREANSARSGSG